MIPVIELRIGNFFHPTMLANGVRLPLTHIVHRVGSVNKLGEIEVIEPRNPENIVFRANQIEPVQLTPELLETWCGFNVTGPSELQHLRSYEKGFIKLKKDGSVYILVNDAGTEQYNIRLATLHDLQNFYFCMNRAELDVKIPS